MFLVIIKKHSQIVTILKNEADDNYNKVNGLSGYKYSNISLK